MSPMIAYRDVRFAPKTLKTIEQAVEIAESYAADGDSLTLRQLYYRFVAAGLVKNDDHEYQRLSSVLNDARYAGLFDWDWITDRTRNVAGGDGDMEDPIEVIDPDHFFMALWKGQTERIEVWVEKDALVEVVGRAAGPLRVPYFSCRGYTSASEVWAGAQRIGGYFDDGAEHVTILHLGDHDPSGIDMTRDVRSRLELFLAGDGYDPDDLTVERIALNMDQVRQYNPPPNPAKMSDSRAHYYVQRFGDESWELDALEPRTLRTLIEDNIRARLDLPAFSERRRREVEGEKTLRAVQENWSTVQDYLRDQGLVD